jgi:hypothetical protein
MGTHSATSTQQRPNSSSSSAHVNAHINETLDWLRGMKALTMVLKPRLGDKYNYILHHLCFEVKGVSLIH